MAKEWIPYDEQLKDVRWLWFRFEVLARDGHKCTKCSKTNHLQAHHKYYESGKLAWEYPMEALITLCRRCHALEHGIITDNLYPRRREGESRPIRTIAEVMIEWLETMINTRVAK